MSALAALAAVAAVLAPAVAAQDDAGTFTDDDGAYYEAPLETLAARGVLDGTECAPGRICPSEPIKRLTMAIWLGRVLSDDEPDEVTSTRFSDVDASQWWAAHIERFAELGVTAGCATDPLRYCPDQTVTRGQMAAFLVRAFDLADAETAGFTDTAGTFFEDEIDSLAAAGVTAGCATDPPRYCPHASVTRGQMATYLHRALTRDSQPPPEPQPTGTIEPLPEDWLDRLNAYRAASGLLPVVANPEWVASIELHLDYLNVAGPYGDPTQASSHHNEDPDSPHYTVEGHTAGQSSNLINGRRTDADAIDGWMRAPYHARPMLHPRLKTVALGRVPTANGRFRHGLDVARGRDGNLYSETVVFPGAGSSVPLTSFTGERPNPLDSCPGYEAPAGLPLIIMFPTLATSGWSLFPPKLVSAYDTATAELQGAGGQTFRTDDGSLCRVLGRSAAFLIANEPLDPGQWKAQYRIPVTDQSITWCFRVYDPPDASGELPGLAGCEEHRDQPSLPSGAPSQFSSVDAGHYSVCALSTVGAIECFEPPGRVGGQGRDIPADRFTAVGAGGSEACGLREDGTIACWGDLHSGLTYGGTPEVPEGRFTALDVGITHSCAVRDDGVVKCWADGFGSEHGQADPPDGRFTDVAVGRSHTCGIRVGGAVTCWGSDQSGYGISAAPSGRFTAITAGEHHTCGLRPDATADCWGPFSEQVAAPSGAFTTIDAGHRHTCGIRRDGSVDCWGTQIYGEANAPGGQFIAVAAGEGFSCGVRVTGHVECWGADRYRQQS